MIDWLIGWLVGWLIHLLIDWFIDWLINCVLIWLTVWLIDWLIDRLIDWLIAWLIEWLIYWFHYDAYPYTFWKLRNWLLTAGSTYQTWNPLFKMTDFKDTLYNMCSGFRLQCFLDSGDKSLYIEFLVEFRGIYYYISNSGFHSRCTGIRGHILIHSIKLVDSKDKLS